MFKVLNNTQQMYKVFFNDRVIFMGSSFKKSLTKEALHFNIQYQSDLINAWEQFLNDAQSRDLILESSAPKKMKQRFFSMFKIVEAAGGIVFNSKNELLCIYRWGKWDLPKGKIEKNESRELAALREVEEECGINGLMLEKLKTTTYHIYPSPKNSSILILKPTYWFLMKYNGEQLLKPQQLEDIVEACWFNKEQLKLAQKNTYASLKELFEVD
jgi:8-oxo-dGTP pyrophosphatase MutT (NUDIX family)